MDPKQKDPSCKEAKEGSLIFPHSHTTEDAYLQSQVDQNKRPYRNLAHFELKQPIVKSYWVSR